MGIERWWCVMGDEGCVDDEDKKLRKYGKRS